jgi:hypothetical protein
MEQNRNIPAPEASTDERASHLNPQPKRAGLAVDAPPEDDWDFPSKEAEDAYWAGFIDGTRNCGGRVEPRLAARARGAYPELVLHLEDHARAREAERVHVDVRAGLVPEGAPAFDPVPVRPRLDGWTPTKQRDYVEALADSGSARHAAAVVGMSEQSAARLRRRADAHGFDLACEAAMRHGARRLRAVAYERAIQGTVRGHYYRGELVSEERVFDNRLLVYLLGKAEKWLQPDPRAEAVADRWQPWMDALEQGDPPPALPEPARAELKPVSAVAEEEDESEGSTSEFKGDEVWTEKGVCWTLFAPPPGFAGSERGEWGDDEYARTLTQREEAAYRERCARTAADLDAAFVAEEEAWRDRFFGFAPAGDLPGTEAELSETFELSEPLPVVQSGKPDGTSPS